MLRRNETALSVFEDITAHTFQKRSVHVRRGNLALLKGWNPFCPILGSVSYQVICSHGTQTLGHLYKPDLPQSCYFATLKVDRLSEMHWSDAMQWWLRCAICLFKKTWPLLAVAHWPFLLSSQGWSSRVKRAICSLRAGFLEVAWPFLRQSCCVEDTFDCFALCSYPCRWLFSCGKPQIVSVLLPIKPDLQPSSFPLSQMAW